MSYLIKLIQPFLTVPPVVKVFPLLQMLSQGSLSTLRCHVDSVPHSEVQWFMNGQVVSTDTNPQHSLHLFLQGGKKIFSVEFSMMFLCINKKVFLTTTLKFLSEINSFFKKY